MSSYELFASVTDPVVGSHMDGTVFCTWCKNNDDRHFTNFNQHSKIEYFDLDKEDVENLAHPLGKRKRAMSLAGNMLFLSINNG